MAMCGRSKIPPAAWPGIVAADWPAERVAKAKRGYAMEYARTVMQEAVALWGADVGGRLLGAAARLVGMQHVHATAATLRVSDFPAFMLAMAAAEGDTAEATPQADRSIIVTRRAVPLFRGIEDPAPAMRDASPA